jgi:hypothetical protein
MGKADERFLSSHTHNFTCMSHGYYHDGFRFDRQDTKESFVLKRYRLKKHTTQIPNDLYAARQEALIMNRLASSSTILDIYCFCGRSVFVETMAEDLHKYVVPGPLSLLVKESVQSTAAHLGTI